MTTNLTNRNTMHNAIYTLDCIKATLRAYNPETATHEEMIECWTRCSRAIVNYYKPLQIEDSEMTAHIVAMEDADKKFEQNP